MFFARLHSNARDCPDLEVRSISDQVAPSTSLVLPTVRMRNCKANDTMLGFELASCTKAGTSE